MQTIEDEIEFEKSLITIIATVTVTLKNNEKRVLQEKGGEVLDELKFRHKSHESKLFVYLGKKGFIDIFIIIGPFIKSLNKDK